MMNIWLPSDPESEQTKEMYAWYGLAMFHAQCLEKQLGIVLATKYGPGPTRITRGQFEDLLNSRFSRTLGQLVREIRKLANLSEGEAEQLQAALVKRNWLAHHYFWDRAVDFMSEAGRDSMIEELQEAAHTFHVLDELIHRETEEWGEARGVSQEVVNKYLQRLMDPLHDSKSKDGS